MATAAGWFPDPLAVHRVRYWDGSAWTHHVADDATAFRDPADGRRFLCETLLFIGPPFIAFFAFLTVAALAGGAPQWALLLAVPTLLFAAGFAFQPYQAVVGLDGRITFRALLRTITIEVDDIIRVGIAGGRGALYGVTDGTRSATLGEFGGGQLAEYLLARRTDLDVPRRLRRRIERRARRPSA